jgi:hypothetical protein
MVDRMVLSEPASTRLYIGRQRLSSDTGTGQLTLFGTGFDGGDKSCSNPDGGGTVHEGSGDASNYDQRSEHQQTEKTRPAT